MRRWLLVAVALGGLLLVGSRGSAFDPGPERVSVGGRDLRVTYVRGFVQFDASRAADLSWIFKEREVSVYCAGSGLTFLHVAGRFAALNGHTSGQTRTMTIVDHDGRRHSVVSASNNANLRGRVVDEDARDETIGRWWSILNAAALRVCP